MSPSTFLNIIFLYIFLTTSTRKIFLNFVIHYVKDKNVFTFLDFPRKFAEIDSENGIMY